jgi:hypothetical protein
MRSVVITGLLISYVTAFFWYWFLLVMLQLPMAPTSMSLADLGLASVGLPIWTLVFGTLSLPLGGPTGIGLCILLRRIDPIEPTLNGGQKEILRAIGALEAGGEGPIWPHHIAERTGGDPGQVAAELEQLCKLGVLKRSASNGYRHAR